MDKRVALQRRIEEWDRRVWSYWLAAPSSAKRVIRYCLLIILGIYSILCFADGGDMDCFLFAGRQLSQGHNPYLPPFLHPDLRYTYGPMCALILAPWAYLPNAVWNGLFTAISLFFIYQVWGLISKGLGRPFSLLQTCLVFVFTIRFLLYNISLIQLTPLLLYACFKTHDWDARGKHFLAGAILALVINIKILPMIMLGWFGLRSRWATLYAVLGFSLVFLLIPALFVGWNANLDLISSWFEAINPFSRGRTFESDKSIHGLPSLLPGLLMHIPDGVDMQRNFLQLPASVVKALLHLSQLTIIILLAIRLHPWIRHTPPRINKWSRETALTLGLFMAAVPLVAPQQQKYAFLFAAPLIAITVFDLFNSPHRTTFWLSLIALVIWFIGSVVSDTAFIGFELNQITQHYKTITWATLILWGTNLAKPWYAFTKPDPGPPPLKALNSKG